MRSALLIPVVACSFSPRDTTAGADAVTADARVDPLDVLPADAPLPDADPCRARLVEAMGSHTCALYEDGRMACWGTNDFGEAGSPGQDTCSAPPVDCNPTPAIVPLPAAATDLVLGDNHTCVITADARVRCFGRNDWGQFGDGSQQSSLASVDVPLRAGHVELAAGELHTCTRAAGGQVLCSGANLWGELGDGTEAEKDTPVEVAGLSAGAIGAGFHHSCAVVGSSLSCWGENSYGQVVSPASGDVLSPVNVPVAGVTRIAGGVFHTCALQDSGAVVCWGRNHIGQLGVGDLAPRTGVVTAVSGGIVDLEAGASHACALDSAGVVHCWGEGHGPSPGPVAFPGVVTDLAVGAYHHCARLADGTVWCAGWRAYGQVGDGVIDGGLTDPQKSLLCP